MNFLYFEVRPFTECKVEGGINSYRDEEEFKAEVLRLAETGNAFETGWTLYGIVKDGAIAIGDFVSRKDAHEIMNAILAPMAAACDKIRNGADEEADNGRIVTAAERAACDLEDFILQSSDNERI